MKKQGIPGTYDGLHRNIMRESSGNPNAINNWDINARTASRPRVCCRSSSRPSTRTTSPARQNISTTRSPTSPPPQLRRRPVRLDRQRQQRVLRPARTLRTTPKGGTPVRGAALRRVVPVPAGRLLAHDLGLVAAQQAGHDEAADDAEDEQDAHVHAPRPAVCSHSGSVSVGFVRVPRRHQVCEVQRGARGGDRPAGRHQPGELLDAGRAVQPGRGSR